jgi:hypothetical protein
MPRRGATTTQSNVARAIRAAQQTGADHVEVRPDGTIIVALKDDKPAPTAPDSMRAETAP